MRRSNRFLCLIVFGISKYYTMNRKVLVYLKVYLVFSVCSSYCSDVLFRDETLYEGSPCQTPDGAPGICSTNCTMEFGSRVERTLCGFKGHDIVICCPHKLKTASYPIIEEVCLDRKRSLEGIREEQRSWIQNLSKDILKWNVLIEEKYTTPPTLPRRVSDHSHMAALGMVKGNNEIDWYCGGTLIHISYVLTAAHCITSKGRSPDIVHVGETDLKTHLEESDVVVTQYVVTAMFIHEDYKPPAYYNDIALLRIMKQFTLKTEPAILPACIWMKDEVPYNNLLEMGYGTPPISEAYLNKLHQTKVTIVPREKCGWTYDSWVNLPRGIINSQICAHDLSDVGSTCEGHSGGPLQYNDNDEFKTPFLIGVTSFSDFCLDGNPGVYTKIAPYLGWIEETIQNSMSLS